MTSIFTAHFYTTKNTHQLLKLEKEKRKKMNMSLFINWKTVLFVKSMLQGKADARLTHNTERDTERQTETERRVFLTPGSYDISVIVQLKQR